MKRSLLHALVCASVLLWLSGLVAAENGTVEPANPPAGWTALRIRILDDHDQPLEAFTYQFVVNWKEGTPLIETADLLEGRHGEIRISAPKECEVTVRIDHPDALRGSGTDVVLARKQGEAVLQASFQMGHRVSGRVIDAATGRPVAEAKVSPQIFTPPLFSPDRGRTVTTTKDGAFRLRGVRSSFVVEHPNYLREEINVGERGSEKSRTVKLRAGETIRGVVTGADHQPLAGVKVSDGSGKEATTGDDGRFVFRGLRKRSGDEWSLSFAKPDFNDKDLRVKHVDPVGLKIQLEPLPHFRGSVVFPNGIPATAYHLVCAPGPHPVSSRAVEIDVQDKDGRFDLVPGALPEHGNDYWIGVQAEGMAPWEDVVHADKLSQAGFRIVLEPGSKLSAVFETAQSSAGDLDVILAPTDRQREESLLTGEHPGAALATRQMSVARGAPWQLAHVRPGDYLLTVRGSGVTPISRPVTMGREDLDLGRVTLPGVGSISGGVHQPFGGRTAWRFAEGGIDLEGPGRDPRWTKQFKADENGRFKVDDVPTGEITVSFSYPVSADMIDALSRSAKVVEGQNTEIRLEGLGGPWTQPVRLRFDGKSAPPSEHGIRTVDNVTTRRPEFRLDVTSLSPGTSSGPDRVEWEMGKGSAGPDIPDLSPGHWRIRVYDWLGSRGFTEGLRGEVTAEVPAGNRSPIVIELGSHMLSGKVSTPTPSRRDVAVQAVEKSNGRVFHARCDKGGDFVIRYLPAGEYAVHAHDGDAGWCDLGTFHLQQPLVDCGEHRLSKGGGAAGVLSGKPLQEVDRSTLQAIAPDGVEILVDEVKPDGTYRFDGMRPGSWVVQFTDQGGEVTRRSVEIRRGQTVDLAGIPTRGIEP